MCQQVLGLVKYLKKEEEEEENWGPLRDWTLAKGAVPSS